MVKSRLMWFGMMAALLFAARGASAQAVGAAFGRKGQVAISAERLLGVYVLDAETEETGTQSAGGGSITITRNNNFNSTTFVLLGNDEAVGPAAVPRLGVDFFVIDGLSIGGSLLYWTDSSEVEGTGINNLPGGPDPINRTRIEIDRNLFGFAPRVGYAYMFSPTFGIWPRGGITYTSRKEDTRTDSFDPVDGSLDFSATSEEKQSLLSLSLEGLLIISPFEHIAFGVGPFLDFGLTGDVENEDTSTGPGADLEQTDGDLNATTFGITSALIAWF
jgi:hypothetical protein